jgi:integrase
VAAETVNRDLRSIRAALRYAADDNRGYILKAPSFRGIFLRTNQKNPVVVPADVQQKIVAAVDSEEFKPRVVSREWWKVFVLLCRETGARRGELLGLDWDRIDFKAKSVRITAETSKGRKDRVLPLGDAADLWQVLADWREKVEGDQVFPWSRATYRQFYEDWERLLDAAGVGNVVPKNLRSTTGSEMVAAGVSTMAVKDWLGHSSVTTTEKYYANTGLALRDAARQRRDWREEAG